MTPIRAARADATVSSIQRQAERAFRLPIGSVQIVNHDGKNTRDDKLIRSVRKDWTEGDTKRQHRNKGAAKAVKLVDDTVIQLLRAKISVAADDDLFGPLRGFFKGAPKKVTFKDVRDLLLANFDASSKEIKQAAKDLTTHLVEAKVARILA
jgi:hypothetical protein